MFKNPKLLTLFFTMVVVMLGFGIIIPIMPFYMEHFGAGGAQLGMLMAIFSVMQFIFSPFWGGLSDRYGRKRILSIGILGNTLSLLIIGFAQNLEMIFVARMIEGAISAATFPTAMAFISDSTTEEERGGGMGVIGAAMGVGMILGPGLGGWLSAHNLSLPFFVAAALSLSTQLVIHFVLQESLPVEKRITDNSIKFRGPQFSVLWKALFGPLSFMLILAFLVNFAMASFEGIFGLYAAKAYNYGPTQVGSVLMVVGVIASLVQMLLTGPATRRLGEVTVIKLTLIASAIGFIFMAIVPNNFLVTVSVGFFIFSNAMLRPSIFSLTSKKSAGGQGMALGLNNAFQSLGRVIGPLWAGFTFDIHLYLPYVSAAIILLLTFGYAVYALRGQPSAPYTVQQSVRSVGDD